MRNKNLLLRRRQLVKVISRYLLDRENFSTDFYEGHFFKKMTNSGYFGKNVLEIIYTGVINLKLKNEATTTLKNSVTVLVFIEKYSIG